jgi:hypothetical protein
VAAALEAAAPAPAPGPVKKCFSFLSRQQTPVKPTLPTESPATAPQPALEIREATPQAP